MHSLGGEELETQVPGGEVLRLGDPRARRARAGEPGSRRAPSPGARRSSPRGSTCAAESARRAHARGRPARRRRRRGRRRRPPRTRSTPPRRSAPRSKWRARAACWGTRSPRPTTARPRSRCCARPSACSTSAARSRTRDEARRELRKLGARAESRGPGGRRGLGRRVVTAREREITDLITERLTNPADRGPAVPEREDDRVAHPQHVHEAGCLITGGGRAPRRTRAA